MKRVLYNHNLKDADTVGSVPVNVDMMKTHVRINNGINVGNRVFASATEQYLTKEDISLDILPCLDMDPVEASEKYDYVIASFANIFNVVTDSFLERMSKWIAQLSIPFFVVGCGIQSRNYEELKTLNKRIGKNTASFVASVEGSGGKIATRGYITKEFLDNCLKNDAVATGCPGLYRRGSTFRLERKNITRDDFSVAFTSWDYPIHWLRKELQEYPKSIIVDQQEFFSRRYKYDNIINVVDSFGMDLGSEYIKQLLAGRVYAPADISCWAERLSKCTYAFGGRLHGSIMALYAGIPAKLYCKDLRCKEVADFIGMPAIDKYDSGIDLYNDYYQTDIDLFNKKYKEGYEIFKQFMEGNGITYDLDDHSAWNKKVDGRSFKDINMLEIEEQEVIRRYYGSGLYYLRNNTIAHFIKKASRRIKTL
jgi:hypothetical protein